MARVSKARCPTVWSRPPLAWVDPLVSPVACEVLNVLARNADVPEDAIRQGVQGGTQPCTFRRSWRALLHLLQKAEMRGVSLAVCPNSSALSIVVMAAPVRRSDLDASRPLDAKVRR
jgi:hypothetical protein